MQQTTQSTPSPQPTHRPRSDARVAVMCVSVVVAMLGLAYASVPLYRLFCQVTGFGGTTQRAERASDRVLDRMITVRFDANVAPGLPWTFEPVDRKVDVKIGETGFVTYRATNTSTRETTGSATFNVVPDQSGIFFNKLECFCFQEQTLKPGQSVDMPVQFFIDPTIADDKNTQQIKEITLSYTMHVQTPTAKPQAPPPVRTGALEGAGVKQ
jgi:cytochrome c oxidase assembly protein subunit 11